MVIDSLHPNEVRSDATVSEKKDNAASADHRPFQGDITLQQLANRDDAPIEEDLLSETEKQELFGPATIAMQEIAREHGITLPENLSSRVRLVSDAAYQRLYKEEIGGSNHEGEFYGTVLPKAGVLLNHDALQRLAERKKLPLQDLIKKFGIHELWHSTDDNNFVFMRAGKDPAVFDSQLHAVGITVERGNYLPEGLKTLMEGFTEQRTKEVLDRIGETDPYSPYPGETEVVDLLAKRIGIDSFYQMATGGAAGIASFATVLDDHYGHYGSHALERLSDYIYQDERNYHPRWQGEPRRYRGAIGAFIQFPKVQPIKKG